MSGANLAQRTVAVLRAVGSVPDGIGLSEISRVSGIPKATCLRILRVLSNEDLVTFDLDSKRYNISMGMLALVVGVLDETNIYAAIQRELAALSESTRETAGIDILGETGVVVVVQVQGPQLISQAAKPVPRVLAEWCTSTGKVLNAWRAVEDVRRRLSGVRSPAQIKTFLSELDKTREQGYGVTYNEFEEGAAAVATPIRVNGDVAAALWIGGPSYRLSRDRIPNLTRRMAASSGRLEALLAVSGSRLFQSATELPLAEFDAQAKEASTS